MVWIITWLGLEGVSRIGKLELFIIVYGEFKAYLGFCRDIMGVKPGCSIWFSTLLEDISRREDLASFDPAREGVCSIVAVGRDFWTRFLGVDEIARRALDGGISLISGNGCPCD